MQKICLKKRKVHVARLDQIETMTYRWTFVLVVFQFFSRFFVSCTFVQFVCCLPKILCELHNSEDPSLTQSFFCGNFESFKTVIHRHCTTTSDFRIVCWRTWLLFDPIAQWIFMFFQQWLWIPRRRHTSCSYCPRQVYLPRGSLVLPRVRGQYCHPWGCHTQRSWTRNLLQSLQGQQLHASIGLWQRYCLSLPKKFARVEKLRP